MLRAIKIRLYPNKEQELKLNQVLGCYRFVYNHMLARKQQIYNETKKSLSVTDLSKYFHGELLKDEKYVWLKEQNTKVMKQSIRQMLSAYDKFFKQHNGFPKFKIIADSLQEVRWTSEKPYVIYGYALINSYGTLVIEEGTKVHFHNGGGLWAFSEGQLRVEGSASNPVIFQGDRLESYYKDEPGQWDRIWLMEAREGHGHSINHAIIRNGFIGIQAQTFIKTNKAPLLIHNTIIENHTGMGIYANLYNMKATNTVVANCGNYAMALTGGGEYIFEQNTIANYWKNSTRTTPSLFFNNVYQDPYGDQYATNFFFEMNNSIMYGNQSNEFETDFHIMGDTTYTFNNSLIKTTYKNKGSFSNFNECVFNKDPKFKDSETFNYHLDTLSPAIGIGNPLYSTGILQYDLDGVARGNTPDAGAYQFVPNE